KYQVEDCVHLSRATVKLKAILLTKMTRC
ncbi:conserved hypothetical protein, partial [Trichinella spiralis]